MRVPNPADEGNRRRFVLAINLSPATTRIIGLAAIDLNALNQVIVAEYASESCWVLLEHWTSSFSDGDECPEVSAVLIPSGHQREYERMQRDVVAFFNIDEEFTDDLPTVVTSRAPVPELFALSKSMFNEVSGRERLVRAAGTGSTTLEECKSPTAGSVKYGAFHALCVFMEEKMGGWLVQPNSLMVRDMSSSSVLMDMIPDDSLESLNVIDETARSRGLHGGCHRGRARDAHETGFLSLFEFLSQYVITKAGKQLLRQNLKQPLLDVDMIRRRQGAVAELMQHQGQLVEVQTALRKVSKTIGGVEMFSRTLRRNAGNESDMGGRKLAKINDKNANSGILALTSSLIQLNEYCDGLGHLEATVSSFRSPPLKSIRKIFEKGRPSRLASSKALMELFEHHVVDLFTRTDTKKSSFMSRSQQIFALKTTPETRLLDVHRARFTVGTEKVNALARRLRETYPAECGNLSVKYSSTRGFYFCVRTRGAELPIDSGLKCLNIPTSAAQINAGARSGITESQAPQQQQVTCEELNALNMRIETASKECLRITQDVLLCHLSTLLNNHMGTLVAMQECIAELDMLTGLAWFALVQESHSRVYVRPLITRHGPALVIQDGRHPMLESQLMDGKGDHVAAPYVANDTMLADDCSTCILTGANMAGKSCYLKQNGLLVILAQIGSLVPASFMSVTPFGGISVIKGPNSFKQSQQIARVLESIRSNSEMSSPGRDRGHLVLVDEVCDVASDIAKLSMSWALIEEFLVSYTKSIVATHVTSLSKLCDLYPNCRALMIDAERKIRSGIVCDGGYGIDLARKMGFPMGVVANASRISSSILERVSRNVTIQEHASLPREREVLKAYSQVQCLRELKERGMVDERRLAHAMRDILQ